MDEADEAHATPLRVEVVAGGDPGDAVLAAVATILTRPVVRVSAATIDDAQDDGPTRSRWTRASRLESVEPGRRISTRADTSWGRRGW